MTFAPDVESGLERRESGRNQAQEIRVYAEIKELSKDRDKQ
jgi:hypothetical protein